MAEEWHKGNPIYWQKGYREGKGLGLSVVQEKEQNIHDWDKIRARSRLTAVPQDSHIFEAERSPKMQILILKL
jgi:hypothetical protein